MRRTLTWVLALVAFAPVARATGPLSKADLVQLLDKGVDRGLILSLVERDCVDFDVDAAAVLELADVVPPDILEMAIACRARRNSLESPATPPGTNAEASHIALSAEPAYQLSQIKAVAVVPFVLDGLTDEALTSVFRDQVEKKKAHYSLQDSLSLAVHFEDSGAYHSNAPIKSLLAAGRAVGVQAIFIGTGSSYQVMGYPGVRLDVRLVEVNRGAVLWSAGGASKGGGFSQQHARKMAASAVAKKLP